MTKNMASGEFPEFLITFTTPKNTFASMGEKVLSLVVLLQTIFLKGNVYLIERKKIFLKKPTWVP